MTLREVMLQVADAFQSVEPGHNGPRSVPETPVRNTAHWINLLAWAYQQTGQVRFAQLGTQLADFLLSHEARPQGYAYKNFVNDSANAGNGLVGQAWVMEGLISATHAFGKQEYLESAQELFHQHQFDAQLGLWRILHVDGSIGSAHATLNQQIWDASPRFNGNPARSAVSEHFGKSYSSFTRRALGHANSRRGREKSVPLSTAARMATNTTATLSQER